MTELKAKGAFQENLVLKIANCLWRYRRVIRYETADISRKLQWAYHADNTPIEEEWTADFIERDESQRQENAVRCHSLPQEPDTKLILFYEMRLDRHLSRAYRLLRHLQLYDQSKSLQDSTPEPQNRGNEPNSPQPPVAPPVTED
jgi:hypothetical protein